MLENLINLVKEHAGDAIINNNAIPNEHNDAAIATTAGSIMDGLKNQITSGGMDGITDIFKSGNSAALTNSISNNVVGELMKKFGLDNSAASGIVASLLPVVMGKLVSKTNDPNDNSFDMGSIIGAVTGNSGGIAGGIGNILGGLFK
jgi:uncharacterized protein YidB (DUF937 family)